MSLQTKKNVVRRELQKRGVLQRGGRNTHDNYTYFSEAQYKSLFTDLFARNGIELSGSVEDVNEFVGTDKQPFGRTVKIRFTLRDTETDEIEETCCFGEGIDRGDKAIYKAMTGALKYWLATNWMVATGDDPEVADEQSDRAPRRAATSAKKGLPAQKEQIKILTELGNKNPDRMEKMLAYYHITTLAELTIEQASQAIQQLNK